MTHTSSSPQVICRPALESDYADIAEFCKGIWEGEDYVPDVWHHWFKDPNGILVTAEYNGHAIGCAKLSLIDKGQWWLEGFRVDPNHQGLKVGSRIHDYVTDWWQSHCDGTVRLMTNAKNVHVHHLCSKTGYVKTHEVCGYNAAPLDEPTDTISLVTATQEAAAFALASESLQLTGNRVDLGWRICTLTEQVFKNYSSDKADFVHTFHWWRDKQGLFSTREDEEDGKRTLVIGVSACDLDDMSALLMDIRRFAAHRKFDEVFQIIFDLPQIVSQLEASGFMKHWERNSFVFEKKHPNRA
ncbi:MAG TPA: GNAT family N-acetyltransferase [Anaerolineales bacterium]|nr:GNAT family N-acetyltransferase [Anaerolineales bacterium]